MTPEVYQKLRAVAPLAKGKMAARETGKVPPVPAEHVAAVLPHPPHQYRRWCSFSCWPLDTAM